MTKKLIQLHAERKQFVSIYQHDQERSYLYATKSIWYAYTWYTGICIQKYKYHAVYHMTKNLF